MKNAYFIIFTLFLFITACSQPDKKAVQESLAEVTAIKTKSPKLDAYWYQGKAEITRYALQQNRYKDVHPGEAILVFVTEDFLTDKQVKNDTYKNPNSVNVLKTNLIRRFVTGIYDYSIMTSVFTPVDVANHPQTLKVTHSSQDWCGQDFMQLNWQDKQYHAQIRSYFEKEGDQDVQVPYAILEDELFNRIRMNPQALPNGNIKILPSLSIARLLHQAFQPEDATASLQKYDQTDFEGADLQSYRVAFANENRTLEIVFEREAPYIIVGWKEAYPSFDGKVRETIAKRTKTVVTPYWEQHGLEDKALRKELGVEGL